MPKRSDAQPVVDAPPFKLTAKQELLDQYLTDEMPLPETWNEDLAGKPEYLKSARNRTKALEYGYDRPENIRVSDGNLIIEVRKDKPNVVGTIREYSSGRVRTKHRGDWKYGRFEIRAKLPRGQGIWPAIWMLPTDEKYGTWASSGEIDIMELVGQKPQQVLGTLHYGDKWPNNKHTGASFDLPQGTFADDFHTFTIQWEKGRIQWFVDGKHYQTQTKWHTPAAAFPAPFDQRFHLLLNVAVGGNLPGNPDGTTKFPQQMLVDFVRVYQRP